MKKAFNFVVIGLVAYLVADRAALHMQQGDVEPASCARSAAQVEFDALSKGFSHAAASSQGDAFRSQCLVMGGSRAAQTVASR